MVMRRVRAGDRLQDEEAGKTSRGLEKGKEHKAFGSVSAEKDKRAKGLETSWIENCTAGFRFCFEAENLHVGIVQRDLVHEHVSADLTHERDNALVHHVPSVTSCDPVGKSHKEIPRGFKCTPQGMMLTRVYVESGG